MNRCSVIVADGTFRGHQCQKPVTVRLRDRDYCSIHDPAKVAERRAKRDAKWDAQLRNREAIDNARRAAYDALDLLKTLVELKCLPKRWDRTARRLIKKGEI